MPRSVIACSGQSRVRTLWAAHRTSILGCAVVVMAAVAAAWLGYEFYRLFRQPAALGSVAIHPGAIDLKIMHAMVRLWFDGKPVYTDPRALLYAYPPASVVLAAPVYGWRALDTVLVVWAVAVIAAVGWLVRRLVRESGAKTPLERAFVALLPLAIYPTGAVIGNGQLTLFVVPLVLAGLLLLRARDGDWRGDIVASLVIVVSLVKPTVAAPFFLIVAFAVGSYRPAVLVCTAYAALTLFAATFQETAPLVLLRQFVAIAPASSLLAGEANLHILLAGLGLGGWAIPASLTVLALLGIWVRGHRRCDLWLLMGVTAIVARFWAYHRWYDDLLILLPMLALFRIAKRAPDGFDLVAGALLGLTLVFMLAPGGLYLLPAPWDKRYVAAQVFVWIVDLSFLALAAARENAREVAPA